MQAAAVAGRPVAVSLCIMCGGARGAGAGRAGRLLVQQFDVVAGVAQRGAVRLAAATVAAVARVLGGEAEVDHAATLKAPVARRGRRRRGSALLGAPPGGTRDEIDSERHGAHGGRGTSACACAGCAGVQVARHDDASKFLTAGTTGDALAAAAAAGTAVRASWLSVEQRRRCSRVGARRRNSGDRRRRKKGRKRSSRVGPSRARGSASLPGNDDAEQGKVDVVLVVVVVLILVRVRCAHGSGVCSCA